MWVQISSRPQMMVWHAINYKFVWGMQGQFLVYQLIKLNLDFIEKWWKSEEANKMVTNEGWNIYWGLGSHWALVNLWWIWWIWSIKWWTMIIHLPVILNVEKSSDWQVDKPPLGPISPICSQRSPFPFN